MTKRPNQDRRYWLTHGYFRTYQIADRIAAIAREPIRYVRELEELTVDGRVSAFLRNWQKESLLHRFAQWVADDMFVSDTSGPYVVTHEQQDEGHIEVRRFLPVDLALRAYGFTRHEPFQIPSPIGRSVKVKHNITRWEESEEAANACYDYFMEHLRLSQAYEDLLAQIADEVFHTMFHNRVAMAGLNTYLSWHVEDLDPDEMHDAPELANQFVAMGRLKRVPPPRWARRAVFFRDHGAVHGVALIFPAL